MHPKGHFQIQTLFHRYFKYGILRPVLRWWRLREPVHCPVRSQHARYRFSRGLDGIDPRHAL